MVVPPPAVKATATGEYLALYEDIETTELRGTNFKWLNGFQQQLETRDCQQGQRWRWVHGNRLHMGGVQQPGQPGDWNSTNIYKPLTQVKETINGYMWFFSTPHQRGVPRHKGRIIDLGISTMLSIWRLDHVSQHGTNYVFEIGEVCRQQLHQLENRSQG